MRGRSVIGRFFAVLAIAGLVLAPIVRPAMAMPMDMDTHASMGEPVAADPVAPAAAPNDMSCCPGKLSLPDCGKDCPLMALCGAAPLHFVSQTSLIVPIAFVSIRFPADQSALVSVARAPPRKPPKI